MARQEPRNASPAQLVRVFSGTCRTAPICYLFASVPRRARDGNCGCSSVVERHLAKVDVEGSSPFTRFQDPWRPTAPGVLSFRHRQAAVKSTGSWRVCPNPVHLTQPALPEDRSPPVATDAADGGKMDWQALAGRAEAFLRDENGGESLEYAITSVIAVTTAAATAVAAQQALNERICAFAENSLGPPTRPE
jgi:hypothetical protein